VRFQDLTLPGTKRCAGTPTARRRHPRCVRVRPRSLAAPRPTRQRGPERILRGDRGLAGRRRRARACSARRPAPMLRCAPTRRERPSTQRPPRILPLGPVPDVPAGGIAAYLLGLLAAPWPRPIRFRVVDTTVPEFCRRFRPLRPLLSASIAARTAARL